MQIKPTALFYMGNKYKLLKQLIPLFPTQIDTFYDLFGGSGVVSLNVESRKTVYNEINENIYNLVNMFREKTPEEIIDRIKHNIEKFDLNTENTDVRSPLSNILEIRAYYGKKYLDFRSWYNNSERKPEDLYTLTYYSFSNLIRFNQKSEFNMPYGNRCYRDKHKVIIEDMCTIMKNKNITCFKEDMFTLINTLNFKENDFIYLDPPYTNTTAIYNEKRAFGGWTGMSDYRLFEILENLDKQNIKWGLSNVYQNKGKVNQHLIDWCTANKWQVHYLDKNYSALGKGNSKSVEVYICNYTNTEKIQENKISERGDILMCKSQMSIYDFESTKYTIEKPIRLIELFSGYGSQLLALKYLGANAVSYKTCEWAVPSIQAYKDIHHSDDNTDYSKDLKVGELIDFLFEKGISRNYNEPMTFEQIRRLGEEKLRKIYNNIKSTNNLVNIQNVKGGGLEIVNTDKYDYILTYSYP